MNGYIAVVSQHRWAVKIHAAASEMTVRPATFRSLCGKPWLIATGPDFEATELEDRCERCEVHVRRLTAPAA